MYAGRDGALNDIGGRVRVVRHFLWWLVHVWRCMKYELLFTQIATCCGLVATPPSTPNPPAPTPTPTDEICMLGYACRNYMQDVTNVNSRNQCRDVAEKVCQDLGHEGQDDGLGVVHVMHRDDAAALPIQAGWRNTEDIFSGSSNQNLSEWTKNRWQYARRTEQCGKTFCIFRCS